MDEHTPNPNPKAAAESDGVGSPAGVADAASESPPLDPQAELQDLDASLSEMTNLLMSGEDADPFDVEGDFADANGVVTAAPSTPLPNPQPDPLAEIDQVQAAVEAALEEAAGDLGGASGLEDAAAAGGGDSSTAGASGTDARTDEPVGAAGGPDAEPPLEAEFDAAEPLEDPNEAMEALAESLEDRAAESDPPVTAIEAESLAETGPAAAVGADPVAHPEGQAEQAPTPIPAPEEAQAAAPAGVPTGSPEETAPRGSAVRPAAKVDLKTRLMAIAVQMATTIAAKAGELLARGIEPVAAALAEQPKLMRHSLAWLALWTAFNAGAIWSYLIFFRSTGHEADPAAMTQISGAAAARGAEGEATRGEPGSPPAAGASDPAAAVLVSPVGG